MSNWNILAKFNTKAAAQEYETKYAATHGCKAAAGGPDKAGPWYVYYFEYTREK